MKKIFSVLTGIAVAVSAAAVLLTAGFNTKTAYAEDPHSHCVCGGNVAVLNDATAPGHAEAVAKHGSCQSVTWTAWTDATKFPNTTGYYYLTVDVSAGNIKPAAAGVDIHVCLNGHKVQSTAARLFTNVNGDASLRHPFNLSLCDCKGTGCIYAKDLADDNDGGLIWVQSNTCNFDFYNVKIDASKRNVKSKKGPVLCTSSACNVNIYDGLYIGGQAGRGGTFGFSGGTVNVFGGTIQGGTAKVVQECYATAIGGNIYMSGGTLNLIAGTVKDGTVYYGNGKTSSSDSTTKDYTADAGNVGMLSGTLNISPDFVLENGSCVNATGVKSDYNAWIWHGTYNGKSYADSSYQINWHFHCECGGNSGTEGSSHVCDADHEWTRLTASQPTLENDRDYYFFLASDWTSSVQFSSYNSDATKMATNTNVHLCLNGYNITADASRGIQAWLNGGTLTVCDCKAHGTGEDYTAGRVGTKTTRTTYVDCSTQQGYVISFKGNVVIYNGIFDASMTDRDNWGGAIYSGGTVDIYGGKIIGGLLRKRNMDPTAGELGGGAVYSGSNFSMYGGEIVGGIVKGASASRGGAVYCCGNFTMNGGTISGGTVYQMNAGKYAYGGLIQCNKTFTLNGGLLTGGKADFDPDRTSTTGVWWAVGGAIYLAGSGNKMTGGTISDCYARSCGGVFMGGKDFTIEGGRIIGCEGGGSGGNICSEGGTLTIGGDAEVSNGKSTSGGNIFMKKGTLNISGGVISGGIATTGDAGNIYANCNTGNGAMNITGGLIEKGTDNGGDKSIPNIGIFYTSGYTYNFKMTGGTVTCDQPSYENAIWAHKSAVLDISGIAYVTKIFAQPGKAPIFHGGYTNQKLDATYMKEGYKTIPLESERSSYGYSFGFEVCLANTVTTESWLVDADNTKITSGITTVAGGGDYKQRTNASLSATALPNYEFLGWAKLDSLDDTTCTLISGATELDYSAQVPSSDVIYVAVFGAKSAPVHYEVYGNAKVEGREKSGYVELGTEITVIYDGEYKFNAYTNEVSKVMSTSSTFTLKLYTDTVIMVLDIPEGNTEKDIVFMTESNQVYTAFSVDGALEELPEVPFHFGKEGGFWSFEANGTEATLQDVNAKLATVDDLTLYLTGYTGKTPQSELTAKTEPQIELSFAGVTAIGNGYTASFGATRLLPEGFTIVEQGILMTTQADSSDDAKAKLVVGGTGVCKLRGVSTENSGVTSANIQSVPAGKNISMYAVGYVVYLRAGSEVPEYLYSEPDMVTCE